MNNYCKVYGKMIIITTAIMSDNLKLLGYAYFNLEVFCRLAIKFTDTVKKKEFRVRIFNMVAPVNEKTAGITCYQHIKL